MLALDVQGRFDFVLEVNSHGEVKVRCTANVRSVRMSTVNTQQILIIEDDEDTRFALCDTLRELGYATELATTAADALSNSLQREAGIVLLDRNLPDATAEELIPKLRRRSPDSFIIVMTGYGDLDSAISCMRLGASDYLVKPVNVEALVESLKRVLLAQQIAQEKLQTTRLAAIADAMTGLSHECRNALQRGQASVDMLMDELSENADAVRLVERIQAAQDDLQRLYEDVKSYAAPIRLTHSDCRIDNTARAAWKELLAFRYAEQATLNETIATEDLNIQADSNALQTVFRNLLDNSLAARKDVTIQISYRDESSAAGSNLIVTVGDNGPGIADDIRLKVFDEFFTTRLRGTGLGLPVCRRLISAHKGRIELANSGDGAKVRFELPRA